MVFLHPAGWLPRLSQHPHQIPINPKVYVAHPGVRRWPGRLMLLGQTSKFCSNKKQIYDRIYLREETAIIETPREQGAQNPKDKKQVPTRERHII